MVLRRLEGVVRLLHDTPTSTPSMPADRVLSAGYDGLHRQTAQQIPMDGHGDGLSRSSTRPTRTRHSRKNPDGHIPRPPNAFILFRSSFIRSQRVSPDVETNHSTLSKIIGLTWKNLPPAERRVWQAKAHAGVEEHRRRFPKYAFRPGHRSAAEKALSVAAKGGKRRVREQAVDDPERCAKIAALLGEGKQGVALEAAVHAFDSQRVFSVAPRFETPMTATAYRRSSSVPILDPTEPVGARFLWLSTNTDAPQRRRSSSTGPPSTHSEGPPSANVEDPSEYGNRLDPLIPSWSSEPENDYFDFSGFSFAPPAAPQFLESNPHTCDPLWPGQPYSSYPMANDFSHCAAQESEYAPQGIDVGTLIAADYAHSLHIQDLPYPDHAPYSDDSSAFSEYMPYGCIGGQEGTANPQPRRPEVEAQFSSSLLAQY
ncbi:hypothetical protein C8R46DRAFT_1071785 [Mycena filopes]|nr:hypothetical protein C8R46DRAFT_1095638 [Mycena filopes]KAJ7181256.1 hypothetical protein C8R46DRAFT_1071785 [Mycena filopes]